MENNLFAGWLSGSAPFFVENGEALYALRAMPSDSVDLILTDPPYFKVVKEAWDREHRKRVDFVEWIGMLADEWARILKPNGSLFCFMGTKTATAVEVEISRVMRPLNRIVWDKPGGERACRCR